MIVNGVTLGSVYALLALGYSMVYGVLKMLNFAHGDVSCRSLFGGTVLAFFQVRHISMPVAAPVAMALGAVLATAALGAVIEPLPIGPLRADPDR